MNTFENLSPSWSQTGKGSLAWSVVSLLTAPTAAGRLRVMVGAHPSGDAPAGHRPVGQRGHRRSTLRRVETPDVYEDHVPIAVFVPDVPGPARGFSPGHVKAPNRHGPTAANMVCCPSAVQMIPTNRLVLTFGDIFGFMLSEGTIVNMPARVSRDHAQVAAPIRRKIVKAPARHMDETGIHVDGRLRWWHAARTDAFVSFWTGTRAPLFNKANPKSKALNFPNPAPARNEFFPFP
ncbi:MAG: transposase [Rhodobacteraceae bacterium]|nr:transposase [Paracoccaceae bacterium]